ncbi:MAG: site-specific DNA-methyltransferase [Hyphomicrobiales bacterium]|nr:site-specific DNA-methyltransferase [Hyphomicrobiales bacterium]
MQKLTDSDPETKSPDLVAQNLSQLKALFPELVTEGKDGAAVNLDVLKQLVGDKTVTDAEEKYGLNWHGKRCARQLALTPSAGTLRPCPEDSVDWDTTQNLMIEGDNLEVLKLFQKSYAGKVKLIYIDPPYNTGHDFVYPDNFQDNIRNYLELTGQVGDGGRKLSSNPEASGRFHTDWLNMMYPRLKLARDLLREDGVIFVSIDDHELQNLGALLDSIFGVENFIGIFVWEKRTTRENRKVFSVNHDYIVCYAREKPIFETVRCLLPRSDENEERFLNPDNDPRGPWQSVSMNAQAGPGRRKEQFYTVTTPSGRKVDPPSGRCWVYTEDRFEELKTDNRVWFGEDGANVPRLKCFRNESDNGIVPHTMWRADEVGTTDTAKKAIKDLFNGIEVFDTPKPIPLLARIVQICTKNQRDEIILDFFGGAAPIGEAVYQQNLADSGKRRFFVVQLPEPLPDDSPATQLGFKTLSQVAIDRLRRAGKKMREESPMFEGDLGFRVFKLASSNIRAWEPDREKLAETLEASIEHLKTDRTEQDILFELLLKLGLDLCVPIETNKVAGGAKQAHEIYSIGGGSLLVCLSPAIPQADVEPLALGLVAWHKALKPAGETTVVFRDSAFTDDVAKTNLTAILHQHGLETVRSL